MSEKINIRNTFEMSLNEIFRFTISVLLLFIPTLYVTFTGLSLPVIFRLGFFIWLFYTMLKPDLFFLNIISLLILDFFSVVTFGILPTEYIYISVIIIIAITINFRVWIRRSLNFFKTYFFLFLVLFLYAFIVSILHSFVITNFLKIFFVFVLLIGFLPETPKHNLLFKIMFLIISLSLTFQGIFSFRQLQSYKADDELERLMWVDPNYLSMVLLIGILISTNFIYNHKANFFKLLNIFFLIAQITVLILLSSRAALFTLVVSILYFIRGNLKMYQLILFFIFLVIAGYIFDDLGFFEQIKERNELAGNLSTFGNRTIIWAQLIYDFLNRNIIEMLFGTGSNSSMFVSNILGEITSPHNNYLEFLLDYGIIGLLYFLMIITIIIRKSNNKLSRSFILVLLLTSLTLSPFNYFAAWIILLYSMATTIDNSATDRNET